MGSHISKWQVAAIRTPDMSLKQMKIVAQMVSWVRDQSYRYNEAL